MMALHFHRGNCEFEEALRSLFFFLPVHIKLIATSEAYLMASCDVDMDEAYGRVKKAGRRWVSNDSSN